MLEDSAHLARNELAAEVVRQFGELRSRIRGSSMLPSIWPGDMLHVRHCAMHEPQPGDIVLFLRHRRLIAHRVVSRSDSQLLTRGDGLPAADSPVTRRELLGRVVAVTRRGELVAHAWSTSWTARTARALFRRFAYAGRLFVRLQALGASK